MPRVCLALAGIDRSYARVVNERGRAAELSIARVLEEQSRTTEYHWSFKEAVQVPYWRCQGASKPIGFKAQPQRAYLTVTLQTPV